MRTLLSLLLLTIFCTCVRAQSPVAFGQRYEIHSEVLCEERVLNVLLPTEYKDSVHHDYPVVYLLDGAVNEDFFHAAGLLRYFDDHEMMPPTILVGIANVDRKRDFTYPSSDPRDQRDFPTTGGSAKFIEFLQGELPAFVEKTFRTTKHRTLVGQSLGGLLATEVLLKYPGHFNDYIIVSPSLWWDKERLYNDMDSLVNALNVFPDRLFTSAGVEYPVMVDGPRKLARLLEDKSRTTFEPLMDEDHNTILHEALYRALDQFYDPTVLHPYHFANAWDGLNVRSAPSLDSAIVAKLDYGQSLGIISAEEGNEATINDMAGKWIYIGSDAGRGWVFDAYVSPVPVFEKPVGIKEFALRTLGLVMSASIADYELDKSGHGIQLYGNGKPAQYLKHTYYEDDEYELQVPDLSLAQARVIVENFLRVNGWPTDLKEKEPWPGIIELTHQIPATSDGQMHTFVYANGLLSLRHRGWFPD
ncbi:SH3 domain-containing protein [Neolewinella aurantiaca]|uniref:SH3 domain-containing protein n=1 Tax=Neolewinella aurantiaca TaxID=2602767 RepID=A0A5C7FWX1_9BACT|nr:alpha/beta hydrolase-fold protein [Neolewinella aurantiaca]TXF91204.1 SH3 domain-containing protein [Neolewinella aurantiaca]